MSINSTLDILLAAFQNKDNLRAVLVAGRDALVATKAKYPDMAAQLDPQIADLEAKIAELDATLTAEGVGNLAVEVLPEVVSFVFNLLHGRIVLAPKPHAGDSV